MSAKLVSGAAWLGGARVAVNLLGFVGTIILARLLTPADFGLVALAMSMLAIVSAFTDKSLNAALVQLQDATTEHFHTMWTLSTLRGLAVALVFAAISPLVADIVDERRLIPVMLALAVSILLAGLGNPRAIMMTKELIFWQQFMLEVGQKIFNLAASLAIAFVYQSYWALIAGIIVGQLAGLLLSYTVLPFRPRPGFRHMRELFSFSAWLTLGGVVNTLNWRFDHLLIGGLLSKTALGFYTVGNNLAIIPTREIMTPLKNTLFPAFSRMNRDAQRMAAAYQRAQSTISLIVLPIGCGMALIAEPFVLLALGERWEPATIVIQGLAAIFALQTLGSLGPSLAMATGQTRMLFFRDLLGFAIRVPLIVAGMLLGGLPGVIYARVLSGTIGIALNMS
ncbi:MAG: lipopolysaccharide biosynthesis protein, partial [Pacificimonas sp.]